MEIRRETVRELRLPYCESLHVRRTVFHGGHGPRAAVVSGIHGDELEGLYLTHRLAAYLEDLSERAPDALLGQVELYPAVNPLGIDSMTRSVPPYGSDLNRNFPGHPEGLFPQRIAAAVLEAVQGAALAVDVHASNIFLREIPQVRIANAFADKLVPLAETMNLDVVWVHGAMTVLEATFAHSANDIGTPCLVVEMGVGMRITPVFTDQVLVGLLHTWRKLGVLDAQLELPPLTNRPLIADDTNVIYLNADTSGLFVAESGHWAGVEADQVLGRIISPHHGRTLAEVRSPTDGVVFTLREFPLVHEGSLLARIVAAHNR